jgi:hypothetical protein
MIDMKIKFFLELAGKDPLTLEPGQEDMLLEMARDGDIQRALKDQLILIQAENEPGAKG